MFFSVLTARNHKPTDYNLVVVVGGVETVENRHKPFCRKDFLPFKNLEKNVESLWNLIQKLFRRLYC